MKQKNKIRFYSLLLIGLSLILVVSCKKDSKTNSSTPTSTIVITTNAVTNIKATTATCGGTVSTSTGKDTVLVTGVCWSTSQNPTYLDNTTSDGYGFGSFTSSLTSLLSNTTYYVRAYAMKNYGIVYGNQVTFKTIVVPKSSLSATVNGVSFTGSSVTVGSDINGNPLIDAKNGSQDMVLSLMDFSVGTHDNTNEYFSGQFTSSSGKMFINGTGSLVINQNNTITGEIKGTFSFKAGCMTDTSTVNVTNGLFDVFH